MIFTLICVALCLVCYWIEKNSHKFSYRAETTAATIELLSGLIGILGLIVCIVTILVGHAFADNQTRRDQIAYEGLCQRLEVIESNYEDVSKSTVIADITEWNDHVYNTKYWAENPWTSWFYSQDYADSLQYIEYTTPQSN